MVLYNIKESNLNKKNCSQSQEDNRKNMTVIIFYTIHWFIAGSEAAVTVSIEKCHQKWCSEGAPNIGMAFGDFWIEIVYKGQHSPLPVYFPQPSHNTTPMCHVKTHTMLCCFKAVAKLSYWFDFFFCLFVLAKSHRGLQSHFHTFN